MLYMWVNSIHCEEETDEVGDDEPYLIMVVVDLKNTLTVSITAPGLGTGDASIPLPASMAVLYGAFEDVAEGNTRYPAFKPFWGLKGDEMPLASPEDAIIIAALMENDNGNPAAARNIASLSASGTIAQTAGQPRGVRVARLLDSVNGAMQTPTGGPNIDQIIEIKELRFEQPELDLAETGQEVAKVLRFRGDGGVYTVGFRARNRGQSAWRFCAKCRAMFFDGFELNKGVCPTGGSHAPAGFTFFLPHDQPLAPNMQRFRFCTKCGTMFQPGTGFGGSPGNPGVCSADGGHESQGFKFNLPESHSGPGQDSWVRCGKCRALFWDGEANKGVCAAGGAHAHAIDLTGQPTNTLKLDFEP